MCPGPQNIDLDIFWTDIVGIHVRDVGLHPVLQL